MEPDLTKPPQFETRNARDEVVQWWKHDSLTNWAQRKNSKGTTLPTVKAWVTKEPLGLSYVLTEGQDIVFATERYEDIAVHIDIMKLDKELPK